MPLTTGSRLASYKITGLLGVGGMGEVYRAHDPKLNRDVAIKVLPDEFNHDADRVSRFNREAQSVAALNHPNIAAIYELAESQATRFLVLELVEGETLAERLRRGPVPVDDALDLSKQILEALEAAHEKGIVHRDLKPANIKITPDGKVKVLDFGLAKIAGEAYGAPTLSNSPTMVSAGSVPGMILGTAAYMSPEQARGKTIDKRTDIWAFGVVLFEMLTGVLPFDGDTVTDVLGAIVHKEPDWNTLPTRTPLAIVRLLRRCLVKDARRRLHDIADARLEIEAAVEEPATAPATDGNRRRLTMLTGVAAISVLVAVTISIVHFRETPVSQPVLRFSIPLPKDALFVGHTISPDGRSIAIEQVIEKFEPIVLRHLDGWNLRSIPGSDGANNIFWSPDSKLMGFLADGKLQKISVEGGSAEVRSTIPGTLGFGGTWNRQGVILVATSEGPILRIPADGGNALPLTKPDRGVSNWHPFFLPDGQHFLYTSIGGSNPGVYVASLDEAAGQRILSDISNATYVPAQNGGGSGYLMFVRAQKLMAQPFDPHSRQLSGTAVEILDRALLSDTDAAAVSISSNGVMTYLAGSQRRTDSRLGWFDAAGKKESDETMRGLDAPFALSPDEKTVALLERPRGVALGDIYLRDLLRGTDTRFTFSEKVRSNLVWSPKGDRIAFSRSETGPFGGDIYWKDVRGGNEQPVLTNNNPKYVNDWSRDGRYLIYTEIDPKTKSDIWYLPVDAPDGKAGKPIALLQTEFEENTAKLSPDGHWLAYVSRETGVWDIYVQEFPSGARKSKISTNGGTQPQWSRDGHQLFYLSGPVLSRTIMSVPIRIGPAGLEAGTPKRLFDVRANDWHPAFGNFFYAVTKDNRRFLVDYVDATSDPVLNVVVNWERAFGIN